MSTQLNAILEERLHQKLTKGRSEAITFYRDFQFMIDNIRDLMVPTGRTNMDNAIRFGFDPNSKKITAQVKEEEFTISNFSMGQFSDRYGIPRNYVRSLMAGDSRHRELLVHNLNEQNSWAKAERNLLRVVDGQINGFLSDRYSRINSAYLIKSFIDGMKKFGAEFSGAIMTDSRLFIEAVIPKIIYIDTPKNGNVGMLFGARLRTSDFGNGKLEIRAFGMQVICSNGMVGETMMSKVHLGSRIPDDLKLSAETYYKDSIAQASIVSDITKLVFSEKVIDDNIRMIKAASDRELNLESSFSWLKRNGMQKDEVIELENIFKRNDEDDGMNGLATFFKLSQAIGTVARNKGGERERELNEVAGQVLIARSL